MKTVTIISVWSKRHKSEPPIRYDVVAQGDDAHSTLEDAFRLTNVRSLPPRVAATSTGDLMLLEGQHYLVEDVGFHPLTTSEAKRIEQLGSEDTSKGYDWLAQEHLL
jgi:hypothetical protein